MKTMLLAFPHPDDESFTCGGTIQKYVKSGWQVHLVTATRGEVGMRGEYGDISDDELGLIRQKELEKVSELLGITSVTFLGYKDGTLAPQNPGELEDALYKKLAEIAPDVVITYEPNGITNHPDHMKLTLATTYAFQKYIDRLQKIPHLGTLKGRIVRDVVREFQKSFSECLEKDADPKLYYACLPQSVVTYFKKTKIYTEESFGKPFVGTPDKFITTVIDITRFAKIKKLALQTHQTQQSDVERFYSVPNNPVAVQEYFMLRMQGKYEVFMGKNDRVENKL